MRNWHSAALECAKQARSLWAQGRNAEAEQAQRTAEELSGHRVWDGQRYVWTLPPMVQEALDG